MENKITEVAYIEAITAASLKGNVSATAELMRIGNIIFPSKITTPVAKKTAKKPAKKKPAAQRAAKKPAKKKPAAQRAAKKPAKKKQSALTKKRNAAIENFKKEKSPSQPPQRTLQQLIDEVNGMQ